jgi:copper chaperone CopZ
MDYYYNCEPGRLRIRTPYLHHNPQNAAVFEKNLRELRGILSVETNPLTGSALIQFDEKIIKSDQVIWFLEKNGYFILSKAKTSDEVIEQATEKVLDVVEKVAIDSSEGGIGES